MKAQLRLRPARASDAGTLLAWRNDPGTRRHYLQPAAVRRPDHERWLRARLQDPRCRLYLAEDAAGRAVGQIRLDREGRGAAISISVAADRRGQGCGTAMIRQGVRAARRAWAVTRVTALVQPANVASAIAFLKAGFVFRRVERVKGRDVYRFERTVP